MDDVLKEFKAKNRKIYVQVVKTNGNPMYYGGYRVRVTDGWWCDWVVRWPNGVMAYEFPERIPKYAEKLVVEAYRFLMDKFPDQKPFYSI